MAIRYFPTNISETDRLLESELNSLECYSAFQLEAPLNSFSDTTLNDHLYKIYHKNQLVSVETMRKLVGFFVRCYKTLLEPRVRAYLDSKKLTLGQWLDAVKNNRRGDILCVYFLSLVMGRHTIVHLKGGINWCTLKVVPLLHKELIERCDIHLIYLGFRIFLRLNRRPPIDVNVLPVLGHVSSDQPDVIARLVASGIKQEPIFTGTTPRQLRPGATAVAGSVAQLPCVEAELKAEPCTSASPKGPKPVTTSKVNVLPFTVNLTRMTQKEIDKHTKSQG